LRKRLEILVDDLNPSIITTRMIGGRPYVPAPQLNLFRCDAQLKVLNKNLEGNIYVFEFYPLYTLQD